MTELDFAIVDPHIHQWDPPRSSHGPSLFARAFGRWPRFYEGVGRSVMPKPLQEFLGRSSGVLFPYAPADYARDTAGLAIDGVVHIEAGWVGLGPLGAVGETRWIDALDFESTSRRLLAIVGHADLRHARADEVLAAHTQASTKFRGIRQKAPRHPDPGVLAWTPLPNLYQDAAFLRGFEKLAARKLRFDAWVYSHQLPDVVALAQRFPEVPIVLDHLGTPVGAVGPVAGVGATEQDRARIVGQWREDLAKLREHKNVFAKLSGLAMPVVGFGYHRRATPPSIEELTDAFRPFIRHAIDVFGIDRAFFASNFPIDKPSAPYGHIYGAYIRLAKELGAHALRPLLRENALRFYGG
jgi:predicted TIM-barrel fold metal-dependent hydrolase